MLSKIIEHFISNLLEVAFYSFMLNFFLIAMWISIAGGIN